MTPRPGGGSNLVLRITTAAIGIPLVLLVNYLGGIAFAAVVGAVAAVGCWELYGLFARAGFFPSRVFGIPAATAAAILPLTGHAPWDGWIITLSAVLMVGGARYLAPNPRGNPLLDWSLTLAGVLYVGVLLGHLTLLRTWDRGAWWVLYALVLTWAYDTGAYFAGRFAGKTPFMQHISPSKTLEGVEGGLALACLGALIGVPSLGLRPWQAIALGLVAGIAAQTGDLAESMIKRRTGAKDSGTIVPGHGGLLDRVDSLLFTAAVTVYVARAFGYGA